MNMLISTEKNSLLVHIPKTAGTSIRANVRPYCEVRPLPTAAGSGTTSTAP
jgi:hypothetical protein